MSSSSEVLCNPLLYMEIMKRKYPETFAEWCCTELSHVLDFSGAENMGQVLLGNVDVRQGKHITRKFSRKRRHLSESSNGIFGSPLNDAGFSYARQLIEHLKTVTDHQGLFRIPGNSGRQQRLKERMNSKAAVNLGSTREFTTNDIACVLKLFLGDLPEPLLTERQYQAHIEAAELTLGLDKSASSSPAQTRLKKLRRSNHIKALKYLTFLLPPINFKLLKELLELLKLVADNERQNMMSAHNLGVIFAPHILWPRYLTTEDLRDQSLVKKLNYAVEFMIKNFSQIFIAPSSLLERCETYVKQGGLVPEESPDRRSEHPPVRPAGNEVDCPSRVGLPQHATVEVGPSCTKTALSKLYADVQAMPEGPVKERLMKQFAGSSFLPGTPTHVQDDLARRSNTRPPRQRSKSVGEAILKQVSTPFHHRKRRPAPPPPEDNGQAREKFHMERTLVTELRTHMVRPPRPKVRKSADAENFFASDHSASTVDCTTNTRLYTPKSSTRGGLKKVKSHGKLPVPVPRNNNTTNGSPNPLGASKRGNVVHPVPRPRGDILKGGKTPPTPMPRKAWTQTTPSLRLNLPQSDV